MGGQSVSVTSEHGLCRGCARAKTGSAARQIPRPAGECAGLRDDAAYSKPVCSSRCITVSNRTIKSCPQQRGLPPSGLQHVGFIQGADGEAFHRSLQVFTNFK